MQTWTETAGRNGSRGKGAGFTLVEILIVTIIALLAALVGPRLMGSLSKSQGKTTKAQIEMLATALDNFRLDNGRYPTQEEGLQVLIEQPETLASWSGPYLKKRKLPVLRLGLPLRVRDTGTARRNRFRSLFPGRGRRRGRRAGKCRDRKLAVIALPENIPGNKRSRPAALQRQVRRKPPRPHLVVEALSNRRSLNSIWSTSACSPMPGHSARNPTSAPPWFRWG